LSVTADVGPHHREAVPTHAEHRWVPVARVTGLAEAGFLQDLLQDRQIPSRVRQWDDFSAVDGSWSTVYIMQVPAEHARPAAAAIEQELKASTDTRDDQAAADSDVDTDSLSGDLGHGTLRWVVPLLAGAAAFCVGYLVRPADKRPVPPAIGHTVRKVETRDDRRLRRHVREKRFSAD